MTRSQVRFAALTCTLVLALAACSKSGDDDSGSTSGTGGAAPAGTGGTTAGGTGGSTAGGTGGSGAGAAGSGMAANMPDATCKAGASGINPDCDNCSCTPDAMNGCLTEVAACQGSTDMMGAMLCKALIDCCVMNNVAGMACATPCMTQVTAALNYMGGAPLTAAMMLGTCSGMKCAAVCPHM